METLEKIRNVLGWVIAVVVVGAATNVLSEYVPRYLAVASGLALLITLSWLLVSSLVRRLRASRSVTTRILLPDSRFKALICCLSAPGAEEAEKQRQQLLDEVERASMLNDTLKNFTGFGSVLRAAEHHRKNLQDCWLIASEDSRPYFEPLESAFRKFFPNVVLHKPVTVRDVYAKIDDVYQKTHMIFENCESETDGRIKPPDIITDVTGGTKIMSIAVAMACLDAERHLQYVEQKTRKDFYEIDITWEKIIRGHRGKRSDCAA